MEMRNQVKTNKMPKNIKKISFSIKLRIINKFNKIKNKIKFKMRKIKRVLVRRRKKKIIIKQITNQLSVKYIYQLNYYLFIDRRNHV